MRLKKIFGDFPEVWSGDNDNFYIIRSPLLNCQTFSIAGICNILTTYTTEECKEHFKTIVGEIHKKQLLIDIELFYLDKIKKIFKQEDFIFETPYRNSTGSEMVMCLIKVMK